MKNFALLALLAFAPAAIAAGLDYGFVEAGYLQGEIEDDLPSEFDGWELRAAARHMATGNSSRV